MKFNLWHCPTQSDRLSGGPVIRSGQRCLALSIWAVMVVSLTANAQDGPTRYLTDLGDPPIGEIVGYLPIDEGSAIAADHTGGLYLFEADQRTKQINVTGEGPCETRRVESFTVVGDTVFVLDNRARRIIGYSISSGRCLYEISNQSLNREVGSMARIGGWFYVVRTGYTSVVPLEEPLLFRVSDAATLEPLGLTLADLEADLLPFFLSMAPRTSQARVRDGLVQFLLPLSQRVWRFDPSTKEVTHIGLSNSSGDISKYSELRDPSQMVKAFGVVEHDLDLFLLDEYLAVQSLFEGELWLGLYSYTGDLIAKGTVDKQVHFAEAGALFALVSTGM